MSFKQLVMFFFKSCRRPPYYVQSFKLVKVHIFWEDHTILRNLRCRFVLCSASQIYGGDFAKNFIIWHENIRGKSASVNTFFGLFTSNFFTNCNWSIVLQSKDKNNLSYMGLKMSYDRKTQATDVRETSLNPMAPLQPPWPRLPPLDPHKKLRNQSSETLPSSVRNFLEAPQRHKVEIV